MPKRLERIISWYPTRSCWRKKYKGKTYYLATGGQCQGEDDQEGYEVALAEWLTIKRAIDAGQAPERTAKPQPTANPVASYRGGIDIKIPAKHLAGMAHDYSADPELPEAVLICPENATVDDLVGAFVGEYRRLAENGDRAISTYREAQDSLADFQGYAKRYKLVRINATEPKRVSHLLRCYRNRQLELIGAGEHSPYTAKRRLRHVRKFLEWAYEAEYIDVLPRIANRNYAKVPLPDPAPKPFPLEDIQTLWQQAITKTKFSRKSYRNALYILLGLNCGYRARDISALRHCHLIQHDGAYVLQRKREKTGSPQCHKLWPETAKLLQDEMPDPADHELMLLDERGGQLVVESLDNKTAKTDCIARCFYRLTAKLGWSGPNKGHSVLRDTGAQALKDKHQPKHIIAQYLGHKDRSVQRHYVTDSLESYAPLFDALDEMRDYFGLKL